MRELLESRESRPPPTPPKAPHTREPTPRLPPTRGSLTGGRPEPFPNLPRSSLQLVEKTKEDEKNFKIWSVGGRANTPLSFWVEDKVAPQPMAQTWRSEREARRPVRGHVRSLLVSSRAESLEGSWVSQDQEVLGELKGELFRWSCDGSTSRIWLSEGQAILSLAVDGCRHFASVSEDGRRMIWGDGDVWLRQDEA
ncbi:unnamed protein product [Effrenium voratum]|nr:unnamed protein product [Effrenium voratum]